MPNKKKTPKENMKHSELHLEFLVYVVKMSVGITLYEGFGKE